MLAPWSNSTSPLVCLSSHAALQMKVDSQPFSSVLGAGAFGSPTLFHWSLLCRGSSCSLCCTGIRKIHKDVAWKAPSADARPQHELQMASFFYNAVKVPILQSFCVSHGLSSSRLHTCLQCLLKGVGYTVNTHTQFLLFIGNNPPSSWQVEEIKALWRPHDLKLARETYESFLVVVYDSRLSSNVTTGHFA